MKLKDIPRDIATIRFPRKEFSGIKNTTGGGTKLVKLARNWLK